MMTGTIYTETVVWSPPAELVSEAPYQLVMVDLPDGRRITGRMTGERVAIGDSVLLTETKNGVPFFRKTA